MRKQTKRAVSEDTLRDRLKRKKTTKARLAVAAFLGHPGAKAIVGPQAGEDDARLGYWAGDLADHGKEAAVRAAVALITLVRDEAGLPAERKVFVEPELELGKAWIECPCADHVEAARAGGAKNQDPWTKWSDVAIYIITLLDSLDADSWSSSASGGLGRVLNVLSGKVSEQRVREALRDQLLPWALGERVPALLGRARVEALRKEGKAAKAWRKRERAAKERAATKRPTAAFGTSKGRLTWNDDGKEWAGKVRIQGKALRVHVVADEGEPAQLLEAAWPAVRRVAQQDAAIRRGAAKHELLELYNDTWSEEERPISPAEFCRRMKLEAVTVYANGRAEVFYADGDMFAGHTIVVGVDARGRVDDATIAG